jgi:hypothetical protein
VRIFDLVRGVQDKPAPVLDARDVLTNPRGVLTRLCETLGLDFTEAMLNWPPGIRDTDGVWAKYWYHKVEHTTSFAAYQPKREPVPEKLLPLLKQCNEFYKYLYQFRLTA